MEDRMTDEPEFPEAELARLADGSLPASDQARLQAKLSAAPELAAALADQQRAMSLVRTIDEPAPDALRARIQEMTAPARAGAHRRRRPLLLPATTLLAVAVAAIVIALQGGAAEPTVSQTLRLTLAASTRPAPSEDAAGANVLRLGVDGIAFPYWQRTVGWRTAGSRTDTVGGRQIVTVFYTGRTGGRVGYAIVSGAPLTVSGGTDVNRAGIRFRLQQDGAARLVTWLRSGHTCVIAGRSVAYNTLLALATAGPA